MPSQTFQLKTVTQVLTDDVELAEAIGLPEVSAVDDAERKWRVTLAAKARVVLADPMLSPATCLHARHVPEVQLDAVEMTFEPPRRSADWQRPAVVTIHFARWTEGEVHHAFVPALSLRVFAPRAELLPERVREHVRLALSTRRKRLTLAAVAELGRVRELRLGDLEVTVQRRTLRQVAEEGETVEEKPSALATLAEELPPVIPKPLASGAAAPAGRKSDAATASSVPAAYEMETELAALAEALAGPHRRSLLLVGPPGCGKTALVRELARRRREFSFGSTPFWSTTAARLMAGPIGFGMWQERCQAMCREASKTEAILHLGPLADLLEVGKASRTELSVGGFLRPWIARGEVLAIAECHPDQLGAIERNDPHLLGAFQVVSIPERTPEQTRRIFERVLADAPGPAVTERAATATALDRLHRLHRRYATYSANPGRALRFLRHLLAGQFPRKNLTEAQVVQAFSRETGLPRVLLDEEVPLDLDATRAWLAGRVMGQPDAVTHVLDLLATIKAGLGRPWRPLASFLFIGPTGTGKTEMAKALAEFLFGDAGRLVRFDLNEFGDALSVQRLIGGPAAGQPEGLLTARVREQPFSVILLDEFEKADAAFFDLLLQILGDGRLTDAAGRVADFCNSVIVMTSNLGAQTLQRGPTGFRVEAPDAPEVNAHFADAVRKFLRPEIYNRLDAIVPFRGLTREIVLGIARQHLDRLMQRDGLRLREVECAWGPEVAEWLAARGYDARYGARPLKRTLERDLLAPLADALNQYSAETPLRATVVVAGQRLKVDVRARVARPAVDAETQAGVERIRAVVQLRRRVGLMQRCAAVGRLEDEVVLLESLQRRAAAARWTNPQLEARLARLPALRQCLEGVAGLVGESCALENEVLDAFHRREVPSPTRVAPEIERIGDGRRGLARRIFHLHHEAPDEVVLAFFGEPRETALEFAAIYFAMASRIGRVEALDYFLPPPEGRKADPKLVRESAKRPDEFFTKLPDKVVGLIFHARGELIRPRLGPEAGQHVVRERKSERRCLMVEVEGKLAEFEPPVGIERPGVIKSMAAKDRRTYHLAESRLDDPQLGKRTWEGRSLAQCMDEMIEERLHRAMEVLTQ